MLRGEDESVASEKGTVRELDDVAEVILKVHVHVDVHFAVSC